MELFQKTIETEINLEYQNSNSFFIPTTNLLLFSLLTAFLFHFDFGNQMQVIAFLKNIGLAGGMLFLIINGPKDFSFEKKKKYVRL